LARQLLRADRERGAVERACNEIAERASTSRGGGRSDRDTPARAAFANRSRGGHLTQPALSIRNLRVDYGGFTAVHDLSLTLQPGEIFGLVGPNGAGKTSTIRVLATLLEPTYGEVSVAGRDLFEAADEVHRVLGYMPDLAPVISDLKVWEFLDLYAHSHGLTGAAKRERVDACLEKVGLGDKRNVYGRALSRGMIQRVVLAKTLLHDPKLLLLDEPASGMDPIARRDMRLILRDLAAGGATIVISSHILSELGDTCTSVGFMHTGKLLRHGPIESVLSSIQSESVRIRIEVLDGAEAAQAYLRARDGVDALQVEGTKLALTFRGNAQARAGLLRDLVAAGVAVASFTPEQLGIESVLMSLIEGDAH
jgi:ABC-2 type transport system ATP-binding protein